ncbi:hypothetical protein ACLQ24_18125 [Micromonospora sp. DT4]|uniref:hypothetical protein n=1 Tax=Micromonospora sp. DT4 TaxID=3393438 RepID=UPI003CE7895B
MAAAAAAAGAVGSLAVVVCTQWYAAPVVDQAHALAQIGTIVCGAGTVILLAVGGAVRRVGEVGSELRAQRRQLTETAGVAGRLTIAMEAMVAERAQLIEWSREQGRRDEAELAMVRERHVRDQAAAELDQARRAEFARGVEVGMAQGYADGLTRWRQMDEGPKPTYEEGYVDGVRTRLGGKRNGASVVRLAPSDGPLNDARPYQAPKDHQGRS